MRNRCPLGMPAEIRIFFCLKTGVWRSQEKQVRYVCGDAVWHWDIITIHKRQKKRLFRIR
mgnify:CR=1 FL=1